MTLNDIVVSLEMAEKLKEAGYPQENGLFYWVCRRARKYSNEKDCWYILEYSHTSNFKGDNIYAAPTASELLGKMGNLSINIQDVGIRGRYCIGGYSLDDPMMYLPLFKRNNLSDALAQMWIHLKENGLLEDK